MKLVTLPDRQSAGRVSLRPDCFLFPLDDAFPLGYGVGSFDQISRKLPYLAVSQAGTVT